MLGLKCLGIMNLYCPTELEVIDNCTLKMYVLHDLLLHSLHRDCRLQ